MSEFIQFMTSELKNVKKKLNKYHIKTIENIPLRCNNGCGKKRVVFIRKVDKKNLKIIWSYENYH